jgi:hypothetical protein
MRLLSVIATLALMTAAPASAQQSGLQEPGVTPPGSQDLQQDSMNVGQGVICDTRDQAKRLVSLQKDGREIKEALGTVNREAQNPIACGPATVLFRVTEQGDGDQLAGQPVSVVKIVVHAINIGDQWSEVPDVEQYAIMPPPGIAI